MLMNDVLMHDADAPSLPLRSKQMLEPPRDGVPVVQLLVPLDGTPLSGLQYAYVFPKHLIKSYID